MEAADESFMEGLRYLLDARGLENTARQSDDYTAERLLGLASECRSIAMTGLVGDPSHWSDEEPPFTCGFGSCRG